MLSQRGHLVATQGKYAVNTDAMLVKVGNSVSEYLIAQCLCTGMSEKWPT